MIYFIIDEPMFWGGLKKITTDACTFIQLIIWSVFRPREVCSTLP